MPFSRQQLRQRAFQRVANTLYSFWEEQKDSCPRSVAVHSRLFDTLVFNEYITMNRRSKDRSYPEHVVPCAYIRNLAFNMFWDGKEPADVAKMVERLLRIAYISTEQAKAIDALHKYSMPIDWDPDTDPITARLDLLGIKVEEPIEIA